MRVRTSSNGLRRAHELIDRFEAGGVDLTVTVSPLTDACEPLAAMIARRIETPDGAPEGHVAPVRLEPRASTGPVRSDGKGT